MNHDRSKDVVFWILGGKRTVDVIAEVNETVNLTRSCMPDIDRVIFTDSPYRNDKFKYSIELAEKPWGNYWHITSTYYMILALRKLMELGYQRALFMHCDAWMLRPVYEMFDILDKYDIAGVHECSRITMAHIGDVPESFPEIQGCGLTFKINGDIENLFTQWLDAYSDNVYKLHPGEESYLYDQGYLRYVLWKSDVKLYVFPPEYNMRVGGDFSGGFASQAVKIVHGRGHRPEAYDVTMNGEINGVGIGPRVWTHVIT